MSKRQYKHIGHKITKLELEKLTEGTNLINLMDDTEFMYCGLASIEGLPLLQNCKTGETDIWTDVSNIFALAL